VQAQANPALEDLIANSDKNNLERVRRVKTAHQRLLSRVLTVREALHRLMGECRASAVLHVACVRKAGALLAGRKGEGGCTFPVFFVP